MDIKEAAGNMFPWDGTLTLSDFFLAAHMFSDKWRRFNSSVSPWLWVPCPKRRLVSSHEVEGYLSLESMCLPKSSECHVQQKQDAESMISEEESNMLDIEEPFDCATLGSEGDYHETNHYDFHVVYSASYKVPVLYFRAYRNDGQPLLFSEIEKDLPGLSVKLLSESKWTFMTQEVNVNSMYASHLFLNIAFIAIMMCFEMEELYSITRLPYVSGFYQRSISPHRFQLKEHPYLNRPWYKLHPCGTSEWMKLLFSSHKSLTTNGSRIEHYLVSWFSVIGQVFGLKIPLEMLNFGC